MMQPLDFTNPTRPTGKDAGVADDKDRFRQLLTLAPVPLVHIADDGQFLHINNRFTRHFGYDLDDVPDLESWWRQAYPDPANRRVVRETWESDVRTAAWEGADIEPREFPLTCKDGSLRHVEVGGIVLGNEHLAMFIDRTEQRRAEREQQELMRELERKNRELAQVVYVASHDLRSPLVNVQGFSRELGASIEELRGLLHEVPMPDDFLDRTLYLLEEDIPESLGFILNSTTQMDRLLTGLLKISRLGRATLTPAELDMNQLVGGVLQSLEHELRDRDARVEVGDLPPCRGDASQVEQVFSNLLGNAMKYADPSRLPRLEITGRRVEDGVEVVVADNGPGIAPDHQEKIFELFHRLSPRDSEGEGLGLTIVRTILDRHNGRVRLESEPGVGSRFIVNLPSSDAELHARTPNRRTTE